MESTSTASNRIAYIDFLRICASFLVVVAHVSLEVVVARDRITPSSWWFGNVIHAFSRFVLPLFVMASGCVLLGSNKMEKIGPFLRRRARRVLLPFAFWCTTYLALAFFLDSDAVSFRSIVVAILSGRPPLHLYFPLLIMGLYVVSPMLRIYVVHAPMQHQGLFSGIFLGLASAAATINYGIGSLHNSVCGIPFNIATLWFPFVGYFLAGYYLNNLRPGRRVVRIALSGFVLSGAGVATGNFLSMNHFGLTERGAFFYSFLSPPFALQALCAFVLARAIFMTYDDVLSARLRRLITVHLAPATYGVYLSHLLILYLLATIQIRSFNPSVYVGIPMTACLAIAGSLFLTKVLLRLPVMREFV